ncbi:MAG: AimR family lysis-lysogeny pheromone receptor [Bacillaceae bacterium]
MIKLKVLLQNKTEDDKSLMEKLAVAAKCQKPAINKFKNEEEREFDSFDGLINIVKTLDESNEFNLMIDYAQQVDVNKKSARFMLEYLDSHGLYAEKQDLLVRMLSATNKESKKWAEIYKIDMMVYQNEIDPFKAMGMLLSQKGNSLEIDVLVSIFCTYIYMDKKIFDQAFSVINSELERVEEIKEIFIKDMFKARLLLLKAEYHSRKNEVEQTRSICEYIVNNVDHPSKKGWAYLHMGNSYILTNYDKANENLTNGLNTGRIYTNIREQLKRSSNFLHNVWNKKPLYLNYENKLATHVHEIAFYNINHGDKIGAMKILETVDLESCIDNEKAFHFFLKGLISENIKDYTKSISYFNKSGDVYYKQLPVMKLTQEPFNVNESIIELLAE